MDGGRVDHERLYKSSAIVTAVFRPLHPDPNCMGSPRLSSFPLYLTHIGLMTYYAPTDHHSKWGVEAKQKTPHNMAYLHQELWCIFAFSET